jgi:hypothetical protein
MLRICKEVCSGAVGLGTVLQAGRSQIRFHVGVGTFSIDLILLATL